MLKNKILLFFSAVLILATSCKDDNLAPILTFDQAEKGAYPALISETDRGINLFDIGGSVYNYTIEFIDLEGGNLVSEYSIQATFEDNNPDNGDKSAGPLELKSFPSSGFETNANGNKGISNITVSASELLGLVGMTADELLAGDVFKITGRVTTTGGQSFTAANSSASVKGAAFRGHFDWSMAASCPTNLAGTWDVVTTAGWCAAPDPAPPFNYQITMTLAADGYDVDDFSFGAYDICYGPTSARPLGNLRIVDVCNSIEITGASQWGEVYTWSNMVIDGNEWSFDWVNDYGEGGSATIINPGGWPPLELK